MTGLCPRRSRFSRGPALMNVTGVCRVACASVLERPPEAKQFSRVRPVRVAPEGLNERDEEHGAHDDTARGDHEEQHAEGNVGERSALDCLDTSPSTDD